MASRQQQKVDLIIVDLRSDDPKKVKKAIKSLEVHGNASVIKPLFGILKEGLPDKLQSQLIELLCSLKDTSVVAEIIDVLEDKEMLELRPLVLTTIWNMKVDFSDYIDDFVLIACKGSFMEAVDCLTIVENLEGPFMEENILESQLHLKAYHEKRDLSSDAQKAEVMSEIAIFIKETDMNLID
ncbi:MAG: hypothetical protein HRT58_21645 [Crocinitomicaceae bacterium]|nr:hypothetical protein [Flavobacteriales bacterium]NQZ38279.1 hypothetical protein [Crocinitomicaceae bacterium]